MLTAYEQFDYSTKMKYNMSGGAIYGNSYKKYDFMIDGNLLFLGNKKQCAKVEVNGETAYISFFGFSEDCSTNHALERDKGTKYMLLWLLVAIMKNYKKVRIIDIADNTKTDCEGKTVFLPKYYFLKYGKQYYEKKFGFQPIFEFESKKKKYQKNLKLRESKKITHKTLLKIYNDFNQNNPQMLTKFYNLLENNDTIVNYLKKIPVKLQYKYCGFYFHMVDYVFSKYFGSGLGQTYRIEFDNRREMIRRVKKWIKTLN